MRGRKGHKEKGGEKERQGDKGRRSEGLEVGKEKETRKGKKKQGETWRGRVSGIDAV